MSFNWKIEHYVKYSVIKSSDILNAATKYRTWIEHSQVDQHILISGLNQPYNHNLHKCARNLPNSEGPLNLKHFLKVKQGFKQ